MDTLDRYAEHPHKERQCSPAQYVRSYGGDPHEHQPQAHKEEGGGDAHEYQAEAHKEEGEKIQKNRLQQANHGQDEAYPAQPLCRAAMASPLSSVKSDQARQEGDPYTEE